MSLKIAVFAGILFLAGTAVHAQNSKENGDPLQHPQTTEEPTHQRDAYTHHKIKGFKWKRQNVRHTAQYEYYRRVELAAKEHQRVLRKLHQPQYANFLYYGHKRKPKKHSAGNLRYCKECGIRH